MAEILKIDLLGSAQEPKGSGHVHTKRLDFNYNGLLAGGAQPPKTGATLDKFKKLIHSSLNSAKDVKLSTTEHKLPWQYDLQGKLYSTESEQLRFKCQWLRGEIDTAIAEGRRTEEIQALYNTLIPLEMDLQLIVAESKFRQRLFCWILGEGTSEEYEHCSWLGKTVQINGRDYSLSEIDDFLHPDYYLDNNAFEEFKTKRLEITQTLLRTYPGLSQGMIEQDDKLVLKAKTFIDYLKRKMPKNDEECYLFFKYIVCGHPVNFDYVCEPRYAKFMMDEKLMKEEVPPPAPLPPSHPDALENTDLEGTPAPKGSTDSKEKQKGRDKAQRTLTLDSEFKESKEEEEEEEELAALKIPTVTTPLQSKRQSSKPIRFTPSNPESDITLQEKLKSGRKSIKKARAKRFEKELSEKYSI